AVVGCGLGGTSLINANVALRAVPRVWEDPRWPAAVRADAAGLLQEGYQAAEAMLRPTPYPAAYPQLPNPAALRRGTAAMRAAATLYRPPINVTFADGPSPSGVPQKACTCCGDCVSGCNYAAKNTTLMNYLPDAWNFGAEIYTQVAVRHLERKDEKWVVHYQ